MLSIGTVCKRAGHEVSILDAALLDLPATSIVKQISNIDIIGLTAMTPYIYEAMSIAIEIKHLNIPVIIGGVHATLFPQLVYDTGLFSAVIAGEAEDSILELLVDFESNKLKPIYYNDPGHSVEIPMLDYGLIDIYAYKPRYPHAQRLPWTSAQTSRGCPYSCTFCTNIFGHKYRGMKPVRVAKMLKMLCADYGVQDITFYDDEFTLDRQRVIGLCKKINAMQLDLMWTCEARVDMVDSELLAYMKQAGCRLIYYGIESGNQAILDRLDKHITLQDVRRAVRLTKEAGIEAAGYFMVGCPGETRDTMNQSIALALGLGLAHAQFSICSPLPGSRLFNLYGKACNWTSYQYLGGTGKVVCPTMLSLRELEGAVDAANALFNEGYTTLHNMS